MVYQLDDSIMVKIVPWVNGSGNITLSYDGQGDGQIVINTDPNDLAIPRSQIIEVTARGKSAQFTVNQQAKQITPYVDLGLPSGLLWARGNIVKVDGSYSIGEPTDYGCYFSWGNIIGHNNGEGYNFGKSNSEQYASTPGAQVSADIPSNDALHDAALACLGSPWRMATKEEFRELYDNTDSEWTTLNGIYGRKFMKKTDHTVYVFFPSAGFGYGINVQYVGTYSYYWSSSWYSADSAYHMYFDSSNVRPMNYLGGRFRGFPVRAVRGSL